MKTGRRFSLVRTLAALSPVERGLIGLVLALAMFLGALGTFTYVNSIEAFKNEQMVLHTHLTIEQLKDVQTLLDDAETGARGFVLSGQQAYLEPYNRALGKISYFVYYLTKLTADNQRQQVRIPVLQRKVAEELQNLKQMIEAQSRSSAKTGNWADILADSKGAMDAIRALLWQMEDEERHLLSMRLTQAREATSRLASTLAMAASAVTVLLVLLFQMLQRSLTERDAANEKAKGQAQLLDLAHDTIIARDMSHEITFWNRGAQATYGWSRGEVIGRNAQALLQMKLPIPLEQIESRLRADQFWEGEVSHTTRDGRLLVVASRWALQRGPDGEPAAILEIDNDITERVRAQQSVKRLNAELEGRVSELDVLNQELSAASGAAQSARDQALEASRFKTEFLANMSHEIRTPMNGILGMTEILDRTAMDERQRGYLNTIREAGFSLLSVINDVLDFSKIEAGKLSLEMIEFDPVQVVESVGELLAPQARQKALSLITFVDPQIPGPLLGDPARLRQILLNLAGNAIKFSHHGEVVIKAFLEGQLPSQVRLHFSVTDSGIGMSEEQVATLFQPFVQADGSTTRKYGGTGLGLSICKRLVELMDGQIGVETKPGQGSTFWFSNPYSRPGQSAPRPSVATDLRELHVLVVDDQPQAREIFHSYLDSWGMRNQESNSAEQALAVLRAAVAAGDPYQVAIIDLVMPGQNGIELAKAIGKDSSLSEIKLIMVTALDIPGTGEEAINLGFQAYLTKPIRQSDLLDALATAVHGTGRRLAAPPEQPLERLASPTMAGPATTSRSELLLIVEDNSINQQVAVLLLKELGFEAHVAENGQECLDRLAQTPYAAVLMDVQMAEMSGFEATRLIRKEETLTGRHLPIIAMTAHAMEGSREECLAAGMDDYLSKPIDSRRLKAILDRWFPPETAQVLSQTEPPAAGPPNSAAQAAQPPLDLPRLQKAIGGSGCRALLTVLTEEASSYREKIRAAVRDRDAAALNRAAHTQKGAYASLCAEPLRAVCAGLEKAAAQAAWDDARMLHQQYEQLLAGLLEFVQAVLAGPQEED